MVPNSVVFKEELPKIATGKRQKFVLRDTANSLGLSCYRAVLNLFYLHDNLYSSIFL